MRKRKLDFELAEEWKEILTPKFNPPEARLEKNPWLISVFAVFTLFLFFIIFIKLFSLQIVRGGNFRERADSNRVQVKVIHAPRGVIYDRGGAVLAANAPAFRLFDPTTQKIKLITREEALELEVKNDPPEADLEVDNVRAYPYGEKLAHVLGYTGEISEDLLKDAKWADYKIGDRIGQAGIEAEYEAILRGKDGGEIIEVDSQNNKLRTLRRVAPQPGQNIYLSIDVRLQEKIFEELTKALDKAGSSAGAAAALDPQSGQILALVSLPSFDPNIFTRFEEQGQIDEILTRQDSPILNRVISGTYPPGSTFKIISAIAALESGKITPQTIFVDTGQIFLGTFRFSNWYFNQYGKVEGAVDLVKALKRSTDTYFYQAAQIIGLQPLVSWARKLNLGEEVGIDLPGEVKGLLPDETWKLNNKGEVWFPGDTLHLSIGQGFVLTTPLQILTMTSFVAADGNLYKPKLFLRVGEGKFKKELLKSNITSKDTLKVVKQGLSEVPKSGGTAWPFFTFPIPTAGKTGTAEYGDPAGRTHAWHTSYAPSDNPKIAMTVLVEGGGEGSSVAAPVVKEAFRFYLSEDKNKLIQDIYTPATESGQTLGE